MSVSQKQQNEPGGPPPEALRADVREAATGDVESQATEALLLWLRWNNAYERVTGAMFDRRSDQRRVEEMMDELDTLRRRAVELSEALVDG